MGLLKEVCYQLGEDKWSAGEDGEDSWETTTEIVIRTMQRLTSTPALRGIHWRGRYLGHVRACVVTGDERRRK